MQNTLLFRTVAAALGCLVAGASVGCQQSYWVVSADLNEVRQLQSAQPPQRPQLPEQLAIRGSRQKDGPTGDAVYLRASTVRPSEDPRDAAEPYVKVYTPGTRGKKIGGAVLLGIGGAMILGGIAMVGYGASLTHRDSLGAGIIAGFGGLPLGIGLALAIPGAVLLRRGLGPSDVVPMGLPDMTYVPPR